MTATYSIFEKKKVNGAHDAVSSAGSSNGDGGTRSRKGKKQKVKEDALEEETPTGSKRKHRAPSLDAPVASTSSKKPKETHPFFGKPAAKPKATAEEPIIVPDSPKRPDAPTFAEGERLKRQRLHEYRGYHARWPNAEDIHVEAAPMQPVATALPFSRKGKARQVDPVELSSRPVRVQEEPLVSRHSPAFVSMGEDDIERLLPRDYEEHPLLKRIAELALDEAWRSDAGSETWTSKYAPTNTAEVLGEVSNRSALALVAWLRELAVSVRSDLSPARKQIRRQVAPKKRKRKEGEFDDFLADSEEDDPVIDLMRDPRLGTPVSSPVRGGSASPKKTPRSGASTQRDDLTNLTLLRGPPGSGKTATVYAAARELDWEVFELSPNGQRAGKDLERHFGGMTTNQHLHKGKQAHVGGTSPRRNFFAPRTNGVSNKKGKAIILDSDEMDEPAPAAKPAAFKQSVILLEEVDILFPDDKGFWEALISLVSKSRRPVIMTCNDSSCLPLNQLPVQEILLFEPPLPELAAAYLKTVALAEGHVVPDTKLLELYASTASDELRAPPSSIGPRPLPPVPKDRVSGQRDLRHALAQLQIFCSALRPDDDPFVDWLSEQQADQMTVDAVESTAEPLKAAAQLTNAFSLADAYIERSQEMFVEEYDGNALPEADVEAGYTVLQMQLDRIKRTVLPEWAREAEMVSTVQNLAIRQAGSLGKQLIQSRPSDEAFDAARRRFCQDAETATQMLHESAPLLPSASITLDYVPFMRAIVEADDLHEAVFDPNAPETMGLAQARRAKTRASTRRYERHLELVPLPGGYMLTNEAADRLRSFSYEHQTH